MNAEDKSPQLPGQDLCITSYRNPLVKRIRRLRRKKYRQKESAFFVEGLRVVLSAFESGVPLDTVVYNSEQLRSELAREALLEQLARGVHCVPLSADVFHYISDRDQPVGLGAIVKAFPLRLETLPVHDEAVFLALIDVAEPGNLGTILRTVDAAGAAGVILVGKTVDPYHPSSVKASMGAVFTVPVVQVKSIEQVQAWSENHSLFTVATSARARSSFWEAELKRPALILLGSEGEGLPIELLDSADQSVAIPMNGSVSSLNLAVAAGLILFEMKRRS